MPTTEAVNLSPREIVSELDRFIVGQNILLDGGALNVTI